uniref:Calponin-homology (CH) domain-containing protein n=1 Tax=Pseudonaja textilis TaxID=8673 RepID=A0A670ZMZ9_PSETE
LHELRTQQTNIESRLKVSLPNDLSAALTDGVVLCHLANHVRPRSVPSIHVPSPAVPKLTIAKCRRNVENFLEACRKIGVPQLGCFLGCRVEEEEEKTGFEEREDEDCEVLDVI